nr:hypothetical protein [Wolbachia endosymbiont of Mansonella perstans]
MFSFLVILQSIDIDAYEELASLYQKGLEKIENEYKPAILNCINGQEEWEKLRISLNAAFADKKSDIVSK